MGFNTSVIVFNDCLDDIRNDPEFGRKFADAISKVCGNTSDGIPVHTLSSVGARIIATHHADTTSVVAFGHNQGVELTTITSTTNKNEPLSQRILRKLATTYGFSLRKNTGGYAPESN